MVKGIPSDIKGICRLRVVAEIVADSRVQLLFFFHGTLDRVTPGKAEQQEQRSDDDPRHASVLSG